MRILLLHVHSPSPAYDQMLAIHRQLPITDPEVCRMFVQFDATLDPHGPMVVQTADDMLSVRGTEERNILGITQKTVCALHYLLVTKEQSYDMVVRSNISTLFHVARLQAWLTAHAPQPLCNFYRGAICYTMGWRDHASGVHDPSLYGTPFAQGICIVMSADLALKLVQLRRSIRYDVVDDVTIGLFLKQHCPVASSQVFSNCVPYIDIHHLITEEEVNQTSVVVMRNKANDYDLERTMDLANMAVIIHSESWRNQTL